MDMYRETTATNPLLHAFLQPYPLGVSRGFAYTAGTTAKESINQDTRPPFRIDSFSLFKNEITSLSFHTMWC